MMRFSEREKLQCPLVEYAAGWGVKRNMKVTNRPIGGIC